MFTEMKFHDSVKSQPEMCELSLMQSILGRGIHFLAFQKVPMTVMWYITSFLCNHVIIHVITLIRFCITYKTVSRFFCGMGNCVEYQLCCIFAVTADHMTKSLGGGSSRSSSFRLNTRRTLSFLLFSFYFTCLSLLHRQLLEGSLAGWGAL